MPCLISGECAWVPLGQRSARLVAEGQILASEGQRLASEGQRLDKLQAAESSHHREGSRPRGGSHCREGSHPREGSHLRERTESTPHNAPSPDLWIFRAAALSRLRLSWYHTTPGHLEQRDPAMRGTNQDAPIPPRVVSAASELRAGKPGAASHCRVSAPETAVNYENAPETSAICNELGTKAGVGPRVTRITDIPKPDS